MKHSQIKVGSCYIAKVSNKLTSVRVDEIGHTGGDGYRRAVTFFSCTNLATKRTVTFRSAQKFRREVKNEENSKSTIKEKLTRFPTKQKKKDTAPHVIVKALAGTGKTTTSIEGLKIIKGEQSELTPSPQQQSIWEAIKESADTAKSICFVAFNKSIATELQQRVPNGVDAMTMHSLGFRAVTNAFGRKQPKIYWPIVNIISELLEMDYREIQRHKPNLIKATEKLVSLCKMTLIDPSRFFGLGQKKEFATKEMVEELQQLATHYDVDLNGDAKEVFDLVPRVLEKCLDVANRDSITFDDMIWLPVALNLPIAHYDLLMIDEVQDLNRCQQALARKVGERLILFGDVNQAIYGFAGADSESMSRLEQELGETDRGCITLPLTVTRRCGKAIVEEAKKIVPEFEAHESNVEGSVSTFKFDGLDLETASPGTQPSDFCYRAISQDGDMVLCRVNAPLVSECFKFIKAGRKANIQGRDVGAGLISTIKKMKAGNIIDLTSSLSEWFQNETQKETRKKQPNENRLIALQDRHDCLSCFIENQTTVEGVISQIEAIFTDDKTSPGIKLSSVHKAKGLEANRVFILLPKGSEMPHPMAKSAWQRGQEMNLKYVAITRGIKELVYVK